MHLIDYTLHLADNALILGHRDSEWTGHGPVLEQDIAISNIALDLVGQSRNLYQYAAMLLSKEGKNLPNGLQNRRIDEDALAFHRDVRDFKNFQLVEQPNGDWAQTILRQFYFSTHQYFLFKSLLTCRDVQLAAIAEKAIKETTYHVRWSSEWVIRLGNGTQESHHRMKNAVSKLSAFTPELFSVSAYEQSLICVSAYEQSLIDEGVIINVYALKGLWQQKVYEVLEEATLSFEEPTSILTNGKQGFHTEHLAELLEEMQYLQRAYPDATW